MQELAANFPAGVSYNVTLDTTDVIHASIDEVMGVGDKYDTANDWYLNRAVRGTTKYPSVVKQILNKNSTDVDTVSGATCSSKAIIEAVNKALLIAEVKGD